MHQEKEVDSKMVMGQKVTVYVLRKLPFNKTKKEIARDKLKGAGGVKSRAKT